ncbi:MAG: sterol desaturase family protein [Myxococcales bacterium]|nr:sterol desaturase family protein [Myxococcales bacterium]
MELSLFGIQPSIATTIGLVVLVNVTFFFVAGGIFHRCLQRLARVNPLRWKHQPKRTQTREMIREKLPLVICNALLLNTMIGAGVAFGSRFGRAYWSVSTYGVPYLVASTAALFLFYHCALFYFHRAMHGPRLFRTFHHLHHRYKAPMFLDALYEHPLEAFYGGIVVTAPLFLFPVNLYGFFFFFSVMGAHEIIDHSGIDVNLPFLSRSRNHDDHHRQSNCFYGQLLPLLDRAHRTNTVPGCPRAQKQRAA